MPDLPRTCLALCGVALLVSAPFGGATPPPTVPAPSASAAAQEPADEASQEALLAEAADLMGAGKMHAALDGPLAQAIAYYQHRYGPNTETRYYAARSGVESFVYVSEAALADQDAVVLGSTWGDAWFMRGSALNSLGRLDEAAMALQKALDLSPRNAMYLIELAYTQGQQKKAAMALATCAQAAAATEFSPANLKRAEQGRALRCQGYNLTELQRFDEALKKYRAALQLDAEDAIAKRELDYIKRQRDRDPRRATPPTEPAGVPTRGEPAAAATARSGS